MKFLNVLVLSVALLGAPILMTSCVKTENVDEQMRLANTFKVSFRALSREALIVLTDNLPEQSDAVLGDFMFAKAELDRFLEGQVDAENVSETLKNLFLRLNTRLELLPDSELARVLNAFADATELAADYFKEGNIPDEINLYANSISNGIQEGIDQYVAANTPTEET